MIIILNGNMVKIGRHMFSPKETICLNFHFGKPDLKTDLRLHAKYRVIFLNCPPPSPSTKKLEYPTAPPLPGVEGHLAIRVQKKSCILPNLFILHPSLYFERPKHKYNGNRSIGDA